MSDHKGVKRLDVQRSLSSGKSVVSFSRMETVTVVEEFCLPRVFLSSLFFL